MKKHIGAIVSILVVIGAAYLLTREGARADAAGGSVSFSPTEGYTETIRIPPIDPEVKASIEKFVDEYYSALREERFEDASEMYAAGILDELGVSGPTLLAEVLQISGVPDEVWAEAIRVEGDTATAEIVTSREEKLFGHYSLLDESGNLIGLWVRTVHLVEEGGEWKLSDDSAHTADDTTEKLQEALETLRKLQEENR